LVAFEHYWFGAKSLPRVEVLLTNMRARFSAFPDALHVLHVWPEMPLESRRLICHWHLQLSDPIYRQFTGDFLPERRDNLRPEVTRDQVVRWVRDLDLRTNTAARWTTSTHTQFASKLLSCAFSAGLLTRNRDPRPLASPRVPVPALEYVLYLLRGVTFEGTLLDNPYLRSVGLVGELLDLRLRTLRGLTFRRQGSLIDFAWHHPDLRAWADATLHNGLAAAPSHPHLTSLGGPG
ncbi:MAG TPA: DUF1819 family protein, partial [Myxococcota bacterium]|nr:DUF1819 family protein [Myxococcota bacterium]